MNAQNRFLYEFGSFQLNPAEHTLLHDGKVVSLTPKVFDTLLILIENSGHLVEKDELMEKVWSDTIVEEANLAKNISILRKVLSNDGLGDSFIETIPKCGYRFTADVKEINIDKSSSKTPQSDLVQSNSKTKIAVIASVLIISVLAIGFYFYSNASKAKALTEKDVILLTDFENKTGEKVFDGILKEGLTIALQQSPFLSIFPDSKAYETLKLMKRNPEEPITRELGRDICQREGLKAYIVGTITKLGSIYVLGLEAVNGQTGERIVLIQTQAGADDQKNILAALSKASTEMRKKLGEPLAQIAKSDKSVDEVTTSSLEALKAFTMARESGRRNDLSEWILHCRRAIKIDPSFAMAHKELAVAYFNLDEYTLAEEADRKAYELRERLSERENLWVTAGHYRWTQEVDKHIATLKLLKSKYPREPDAMNDLGLEYQWIGDYKKALEEFRLAVNTPPKDLIIFGNLVKAYMHLNRYEEAKKTVEKAVNNGFERQHFEYLLYLLAFINDDEAEMQRVVELNNGKKIHPWLRVYLKAYSGQWQQSMKFYRQINLQGQETKERQAARNAFRAMTAAEIGQCSQAQSLANDSLKRFRSSFLMWRATFVFARCGNISRTQLLINEIQEKYPYSTYYNGFGIPIYRAMIELHKDNPKEAIKLLETVRRYESASFYWVQTVRGEAYLKLNENEKARIEFQTILDHRGWYSFSPLYPLAQLGKARAMKDKREYEKFFEMWKDADEDLEILIEAKREYENLQ
jgi:DNA-binding winged helix-turn-helix (wHTH) protein/tetratricopeptide (TPR) repeat protein